MANYNISVVVDPSGALSSINVVESGLGKLPGKAREVESAIQRAFDFNAGAASSAVNSVDQAMKGLKTSSDSVARSTKNVSDSFRVLHASSVQQAEDLRTINQNLQALYQGQNRLATTNKVVVNSQAQVRQSSISMGQQFNDLSTQVLSGQSVITAFAQQSGQAAFAMQGFNGWLGTVGRFLAGPWGTIGIIATTVLAGFVAKNWEANSALEDAVDKLKKDAQETEITRQAKEQFKNTEEGVTAAIREHTAALKEQEEQLKSAAERARDDVALNIQREIAIRRTTKALLEQAIANKEASQSFVDPSGGVGAEARQNFYTDYIDTLTKRVGEQDQKLSELFTLLEKRQSFVDVEIGTRQADPIEQIRRKYEGPNGLIELARKRAVEEGKVGKALQDEVKAVRLKQKAEEDAARAAEQRAKKAAASPYGAGVSVFKSQQQAIGVAGRELQKSGLRVSENEQFGGISPGVHQSSHRNAIDVNVGRGVTESQIPDLKSRFDELARRYQARGYEVIWNGQFYAAGGNGPTRAAKGHYGHMHVQAPRTIVGKPTGASSEAAAQAEDRVRNQQGDFVQQAIDVANVRGQQGVANTAEAQINKVFQDYKRRFDQEMSPEDKGRVSGAINSAVARETAAYFDQAYVKPLERLEALQGKTGEEREILNRKLEETARLGKELTPEQEKQIENSVKQGNALALQNEILESIRGPQEDYMKRLEALNELLRRGEINQTQYNSRVSDLGTSVRDALSNLPGADPVTGQSYSDIAARGDEEGRYNKELELFESNKQMLLEMGINYDGLIEAAHQRHVNNMNAIDAARKSAALTAAQSTAESLASIAEAGLGQQSAIYKAMFIASKAFAIADSIVKIQQGIANALSLPFPANLGAVATVAAQAASIVASIQAVSLNLANGGYVTGPGTSRSDSIPANLSNGEFVVNAQATRQNRALLEAINSGRRPTSVNSDIGHTTQAGENVLVQVGDVNVHVSGAADGKQIGREVKDAITGIVRNELRTQSRSGGALTKTSTSVMAGG